MEVAVRSYFATGVALVGAGVIAVSPVVPRPDVELPALPAVHASVPVELTALENPLELVAQLVQQSLANVTTLGNKVLSDPAPILQQILTNQMANAGELASDLQQFLANSAAAITQDVPQQIQMALTAFQGGHITDGLNDLVGAVLLPVLGNGLSNLAPIQDVFNVLARPVQNVANLINAGPSILLNAAIAPILVLSNFVNAVGNGAEGVIGAVQTGNPLKVATALADGAIGLVAAAINSVIDPNNGVIAAVLNLRNVVAQALGAPVAFAAKSPVTDVPSSTAKMVALSTTSAATQTPAKEDAKTPSDSAMADKDAGSTAASAAGDSTDAKSSTATGTDTSSAATDSNAATGTESQSSTDTDGKAATGASAKDETDGKGATDSTGATSDVKGSTSDSSSSTATKSDSGSTKTSAPKKDGDKEKANEKADNEKAASENTAKK
jgi:hypothetical protein